MNNKKTSRSEQNAPTSRKKKSSKSKFRGSKPTKPGTPRQSGRKKSTLNPQLLVRKATQTIETEYAPDRSFEDMPIDQRLKAALRQKGFEQPTEIQDKSLEDLLEGRDMLGIAQTGTGKTGAFLIPVIHQLLQHRQKPFALVVVPTRELALQVQDEFKSMTKGLKLFSACFIGGTNINKDMNVLGRPSHVVIATPGRLLDLVKRKGIDLRPFNTLILDEFDRMLDMGFVKDVQRILHLMPNRNQNLLFSATLDKKQKSLIADILHNPVTVQLSSGQSSGETIDQEIVKIGKDDDKFQVLKRMIIDGNFEKVLVFEETKHRVNRLTQKLNKAGLKADQIQGNKSQNARQKALSAFKKGQIRVLVATDVAARGIDVSDVTHVINYQVPQTMDSYIHRIGRTGRAGKAGKAFTFVD